MKQALYTVSSASNISNFKLVLYGMVDTYKHVELVEPKRGYETPFNRKTVPVLTKHLVEALIRAGAIPEPETNIYCILVSETPEGFSVQYTQEDGLLSPSEIHINLS